MILRLEQLNKDLFSAEFQLMCGENKVGELRFQGGLASMEGVWSGYIFNRNIAMKRTRGIRKAFRPYAVSIDGVQCGNVYQTDTKEGFFKPKLYFHHLELGGQIADIFPIGCGKVVCSPVYAGDRQVSLVEKSLTIYNDCHIFDIFALDDNSAFLTVLLCMYMYTIGYYKAGEKPINTVHKGYVIEKEKNLLAKYDPEFKKRYFNL